MEMEKWRRVTPARPAAGYIGGKKQLSGRLAAMIEQVPHRTYAEPFVGMGGVFLRRSIAPPVEVINDLSGDVATFFRILQRHYVPFMDLLRFRFTSRAEFERLNATDPATLTDLERAVRFLYLQRTTFGGKVAGRSFGVAVDRPGRFDVTKLGEILTALNERLAGVVIENLPYAEFIARYDSAETLFFLDPPYFGTEDFYGAGMFGRGDFGRLERQLDGIAGSFILTVNDLPETRQIFGPFDQERAEVTYTAAEGSGKPAAELIVSRITRRRQPTLPLE
jgi:DNA adenine methylase